MEAAGAQGAAIRLTEALRDRGHEAETWFLYVKRPVYVDQRNVRVVMPNKPGATDLPRLLWRLRSMIAEFKPDCMFAFTHYASAIGAPVAALTGVRARIATVRRPFNEYPAGARIANTIAGSIGVASRTIAVSAATTESCAHLPAAFKRMLITVSNGVDVRRSVLSVHEARERFGVPIDARLILTTGRLSPEKNQQVLVRILEHQANVDLAIAGEGPARASLAATAKRLGVENRVHLVGELPPSSVPDFLAMEGIFAFPSRYEAFGFSVVEAMATGLPVVASDIPAMREILGDSGTDEAGIRVTPDSIEEWTAAIKGLFENPGRMHTLAHLAALRARHFSLSTMVDGYEAAMEELLTARHRGSR